MFVMCLSIIMARLFIQSFPLQQFDKLKIYHCADDPDASKVISKPVATHYDICAISNPSCIDMYKSWGCKNVFFWPLGAFYYLCDSEYSIPDLSENMRDVPLVFIGSKLGVPIIRYIGKYLGLYKKKRFFGKIEKTFSQLLAYGSGWSRGRLPDDEAGSLYSRSMIGLNVHNSIGPINGRLYDLAAFGVCQICDNKSNLSQVFEEGKEIVGFENTDECIDLIRFYLALPDEAQDIGAAGRKRFLRDYTLSSIWAAFFDNIDGIICNGL